MINDMIDLEPVLGQYDSEIILVGPLLNLSMSSSYRYFYVAGKGSKIYNSVGLGFVDNESDAETQRANVIEKLKGRFAEVATFDSHTEMAQAVHARWQSEETARVLSSAEIAAKAEPAKFAVDEAITDGTEGRGPPRVLSERLADALARELWQDAQRAEKTPMDPPALTATSDRSATEQPRQRELAQSEVALTAKSAPTQMAARETSNGSRYWSGLTESNDQFNNGLAPELFDLASRDQGTQWARPVDGPTPANDLPSLLASAAPTSKAEPTKLAGHENAIGTGYESNSAEGDDQIVDMLARRLADHAGGDQKRPVRLPPVAKLPALTTGPTESTGGQHRDFGLTEDDLASAVLKLRSALELSGLPVPAEPTRNQPDSAAIAPIELARGNTSTILRFAALGAAVVLVGVLALPNTRQRVKELVQVATVLPRPVSNNGHGPAVPVSPPAQLAEAAAPIPQAETARSTAVASLPAAPRSGVKAAGAAGAPVFGRHAPAVTPSTVAASPTSQPSKAQNIKASTAAPPSDQETPATAPSTVVASLPATPPSEGEDAGAAGAPVSSQHAPGVTPGKVALPPASQPAEGENAKASAVPPSDREAPATAPTPVPAGSSPAALPSERESTKGSAAPPSDQEAPAAAPSTVPASLSSAAKGTKAAGGPGSVQRAQTEASTPDRADIEAIAKLVNRGMQSLKGGDLKSAGLSLQRAADAISGSTVALPPAGNGVHHPAPLEASQTAVTPLPDHSAVVTDPGQQTGSPLATAAVLEPPHPAQVAALDARSAPVTGQTTSPAAGMPASNYRAPLTGPSQQTAPLPPTAPVAMPTRPSHVATLDPGSNPVTGHTLPPPAASTNRQLGSDEIAILLKRGTDFLQSGDFAAARLALRRAAEAGNAEAALALGATYDPLVLKQLGAVGIESDVTRARQWYQKAADLGSSAAQQRLAKLAPNSQ